MQRIAIRITACTLALAITGCFEIGKYAVQHSIGARLSSCQASKDSVEAMLGKPYRRYFSDDENVTERTQVFWHEWGYRIVRDSSSAAVVRDSTATVPDSVKVIGFRWGDGLARCDVQERRVLRGTHPSVPWEGAGDVPPVP